ncbi:MAG: glycosyltransferase family 4 protein [Candidatus Acidiferrales bacterium]
MRVAIDIRRAGDFGFGTYTRNVLYNLAQIDRESHYLLIGQRRHLDLCPLLPDNFELYEFAPDPGSFRTHFALPYKLRGRIDLLHMPWFYAPAFVPTKLIITVHDLTEVLQPARGTSPLVQAGRLYFARRALRKASRILTVSQTARRDLARAFPVDESKVEVIYNAVDDGFRTQPLPFDADLILERHAATDPYVLYAGSIKPQKNLPRLIEAFAVAKSELQSHPEFANLKLLLIGNALAEHSDLRRAVVRSRVRGDVRFLGFVPLPVLRVFYAHARAFLFPSLYEGFGFPPLEAMAHGTPVLASNDTSLPEILGDAALQVNAENVFEIARGIVQILTDEELRRTLIHRGFTQVERYSWRRSAEQVRQVYEDVLASRKPA